MGGFLLFRIFPLFLLQCTHFPYFVAVSTINCRLDTGLEPGVTETGAC